MINGYSFFVVLKCDIKYPRRKITSWHINVSINICYLLHKSLADTSRLCSKYKCKLRILCNISFLRYSAYSHCTHKDSVCLHKKSEFEYIALWDAYQHRIYGSLFRGSICYATFRKSKIRRYIMKYHRRYSLDVYLMTLLSLKKSKTLNTKNIQILFVKF